MIRLPDVGTLVIGGGPAGLAPLVAASRGDGLDALLAGGLLVVERGPRVGAGRLGRYGIESDSSAETFLSAVVDHPDPSFAILAEHPVARRIARLGRDAVPLGLAASFLDLIGDVLAGKLRDHPRGGVLVGHKAVSVRRMPDGRWLAGMRRSCDGGLVEVVASGVLFAMGGTPDGHETALVGGRPLSVVGDRLIHSEAVLDTLMLETVMARLAPVPRPRIVVVGASTSAIASVRVLLRSLGARLDPGALVLMHRGRLLPWYRSAEEALADGYDAFGVADICPLSGMVHRFGGLRYESRNVVRAALGLGGLALDGRIALHPLVEADAARDKTRVLLSEADLVVSAVGYQPNRPEVLDLRGVPSALMADRPRMPLVGANAGVLSRAGGEIENLFAIGLAAGFRPGAGFGGEPSFRGQVNGLWLWQNDVGRMIAGKLLDAARASLQDVAA